MPYFPYQPESPITERLEFLTDLMPMKGGGEQRLCLRNFPRQFFTFDLLVEDKDRQKIENLVIGNFNAEWFVPVWTEPTILAADVTAPVAEITLQEFALRDYRFGEGQHLMLWGDEDNFDVLENVTEDMAVITGTNDLTQDFPAGTTVYQLRRCRMASQPTTQRYKVNVTRYTFTFRVEDNFTGLPDDLTDATTLLSIDRGYNKGLDMPNLMYGETISEGFEQERVIIDGQTGAVEPVSAWTRAKRLTTKGIKTRTRADLWALRRFLHWSKGRLHTFFAPTFGKDLTLVAPISEGDTTIRVKNVGYTSWRFQNFTTNNYTFDTIPMSAIRLTTTDLFTPPDDDELSFGQTVFHFYVTGSTVIDPDTEELTVIPVGGEATTIEFDFALDQVARIDISERVRIDTDAIEIQHIDALGQTKTTFPLKTVEQENLTNYNPPVGGYYQARTPTDSKPGELVNLWLPASLIPAPGEDYNFRYAVDNECYYIHYPDGLGTPGIIAAAWETISNTNTNVTCHIEDTFSCPFYVDFVDQHSAMDIDTQWGTVESTEPRWYVGDGGADTLLAQDMENGIILSPGIYCLQYVTGSYHDSEETGYFTRQGFEFVRSNDDFSDWEPMGGEMPGKNELPTFDDQFGAYSRDHSTGNTDDLGNQSARRYFVLSRPRKVGLRYVVEDSTATDVVPDPETNIWLDNPKWKIRCLTCNEITDIGPDPDAGNAPSPRKAPGVLWTPGVYWPQVGTVVFLDGPLEGTSQRMDLIDDGGDDGWVYRGNVVGYGACGIAPSMLETEDQHCANIWPFSFCSSSDTGVNGGRYLKSTELYSVCPTTGEYVCADTGQIVNIFFGDDPDELTEVEPEPDGDELPELFDAMGSQFDSVY